MHEQNGGEIRVWSFTSYWMNWNWWASFLIPDASETRAFPKHSHVISSTLLPRHPVNARRRLNTARILTLDFFGTTKLASHLLFDLRFHHNRSTCNGTF
jgi:hypothetical protein